MPPADASPSTPPETSLHRARNLAVAALAARSPLDIGKPASGFAASVVGEQAEAVVPYLARFQPVRMKASAVPLVILACVLPVSWVAGLILLVSAPLIPVFMALIGWRAKAASEKQLAETGGLNAFLLDRLRGLATIRALGAVDATALRLRADADSLRNRTMAVLKIAFLSSAVLELFAALGVAAIAVYIGFSLLGSIDFGTWARPARLLREGLFILLLAPAFFEPLRELSAVWHDRATGEAALAGTRRPIARTDLRFSVAMSLTPTTHEPCLRLPPCRSTDSVFRHAPDLADGDRRLRSRRRGRRTCRPLGRQRLGQDHHAVPDRRACIPGSRHDQDRRRPAD